MAVWQRWVVGMAVVGVTACAQVTPVAEGVAQLPRKAVEQTAAFFEKLFSEPAPAVDVYEIARVQDCHSSGHESALQLFADPGQITAWETTHGVKLTVDSAALPAGMYAVAEMGERPTGGYALAVSRQAALQEDTLYVKATYLVPSTALMATPAVTSPCSLLLVPTHGYRSALLLDQSNTVRARYTVAATPVPATP